MKKPGANFFVLLCVLTIFLTTVVLTIAGAKVAFHGASAWTLVWVVVAGTVLAGIALAKSRSRA